MSYHDGFLGLSEWAGFLPNADRIALDDHPYLCFDSQSAAPMSSYAQTPCDTWASNFNTSMGAFGLTGAGEFSNAVTDCGLWVNGVGLGTRYEGNYTGGNWPVIGSCTPWNDWQSWNTTMKTDIMNFALASMDALQVRVSLLRSNDTMMSARHDDRIGFSGRGKLVLLQLVASSNRRNGHIPLDCKMAGCPPTLAQLQDCAQTRAYGVLHFSHGRQEERVLDKSQLL